MDYSSEMLDPDSETKGKKRKCRAAVSLS